MYRIDKINEIKSTLKQLFSTNSEVETDPSDTEQEFGTFTLSDGTTKITTSSTELEIGTEVFYVDDMGNQTVLDPGDYVLTDGRTITVKDNLITEIKGKDSTEPVSPVEDANVGNTMEATQMSEDGMPIEPTEVNGDLNKRITDLEKTLEEVMNMLSKLSEGQIKVNDQMMSRIEEIADEPGEKSIRLGKKGMGDYSKEGLKKIAKNNALEELRVTMSKMAKK